MSSDNQDPLEKAAVEFVAAQKREIRTRYIGVTAALRTE